MSGTVAKLGHGVTADSMGQPLKIGDRVLYRYFCPCGRCKACLRRQYKSCPTRQANWLVSCEVWPHFQGGFGQYFYLRPNHAVFKIGPRSPTRWRPASTALTRRCMRGSNRPVPRRANGGRAGRGRARRLRVRRGARDGREPGGGHRRARRTARAGEAVRRHRHRRHAPRTRRPPSDRRGQEAHRRAGAATWSSSWWAIPASSTKACA